jgi:hypothetical protein
MRRKHSPREHDGRLRAGGNGRGLAKARGNRSRAAALPRIPGKKLCVRLLKSGIE